LELLNLDFIRLKADTDLSAFSFCCGDDDLNEFLFDDSKSYLVAHLAMTYLFCKENAIVAYFSLSNDILKHKQGFFGSRSAYKDFKKKKMGLTHNLYGHELPSMKIGRLAICKDFQRKGVGAQLLDFIKSTIYKQRFAGCRLITVDAYNQAVPFYEKNQFTQLISDNKDAPTKTMYFDLNSLE